MGAADRSPRSPRDRPRPGSTLLDIEFYYALRATNVFYNLVYPFYLQEGQPT